MTAAAPTLVLPNTASVIDYLGELRRELRFSDKLDQYVTDQIKFHVRGEEAKKAVRNPSPDTACWSFRGDKPGVHLIHFCIGLFKKMRPGADWKGYVSAYAHHELCHAAETKPVIEAYRDAMGSAAKGGLLQIVNNALKKEGVPFGLYNLFEDARIEAVGRAKLDFPMAWLDYEDLKAAEVPQAYFFNLIQNRGINDPCLVDTKLAAEAWVERVRDHYFAKAILAHDFEQMLKLLKEWTQEFPTPMGKGGFKIAFAGATGGANGEGDLEGSLTVELSAETFAALCQLADAQAGTPAGAKEPTSAGMGEMHSVEPIPDFTSHKITQDDLGRELNRDLAEKVAERLKLLLSPSPYRERSTAPAKRISARSFMAGKPDFYRRKVGGRNTRPIDLVYFTDCSGSMQQAGDNQVSAIDGGIAIAMGLNSLARRGLVTGHIVLHKGEGTTPMVAAYPLPQPDHFFTTIPSDGGWEGLNHAFQKCAPLLQRADYVFCYTDGHICDSRVDIKWLEARGIRPIGLYCGETRCAEPLKAWFACALIRDTVLNLLEAMVATIDFSQAKRGRLR